MTQGQLAWYRAMEERGELTPITDRAALDRHVARWDERAPARKPDAPDRLRAEPRGGRLDRDAARTSSAPTRRGCAPSGPAHYGPGVYAQGTNACGDLGTRGRELLRGDGRARHHPRRHPSVRRELPRRARSFPGPVWASHSNCRALVPHSRQFSDDHIRELVAARRGHRRGLRRVDAGARLGARRVDAGPRRRHARDRGRITSTTSARSPATPGTAASDPISTARSDASSVPPTSRRLPISPGSRRCSPRAATARRTSTLDRARQLPAVSAKRVAVARGSTGFRGVPQGSTAGSVPLGSVPPGSVPPGSVPPGSFHWVRLALSRRQWSTSRPWR